ncbi:MAG TPA: hypothetical protein VEC18_00790, partial [Myxococcota bacterium]|nr:hypothetical protein [Myxococcota bacterium]
MKPIFPPIAAGGIETVQSATSGSKRASWTFSARTFASTLAAAALSLLLFHSTGNLLAAGAAAVCGAALVALLEQRIAENAAHARAVLRRAMDALARGDCSVQLDADALGDLAEYADSFNRYVESLAKSHAIVGD